MLIDDVCVSCSKKADGADLGDYVIVQDEY
jgi:hypothetical protein